VTSAGHPCRGADESADTGATTRKLRILIFAASALIAAACGTANEEAGGIARTDQLVTATATDAAGSQAAVASLETPASTTDAAAAEVNSEQAILSFVACLREEGIDMNAPEVDEDGNLQINFRGLVQGEFDRDTMQAARDSCGERIEGVAQRFELVDRTSIEDTLVAFAACMRDNGFDLPGPDLSHAPGERGGKGPFGELDQDDSDFAAANAVCQAEFGGGIVIGPGAASGGRGGGAARSSDSGRPMDRCWASLQGFGVKRDIRFTVCSHHGTTVTFTNAAFWRNDEIPMGPCDGPRSASGARGRGVWQ